MSQFFGKYGIFHTHKEKLVQDFRNSAVTNDSFLNQIKHMKDVIKVVCRYVRFRPVYLIFQIWAIRDNVLLFPDLTELLADAIELYKGNYLVHI